MSIRARAVLTAAAFAAFHAILAAVLGLVDDEAYYVMWASVPSLGYYDHPPMVAWWIAASERVLGTGPLAVRLPFVLAWFAVSLMTYRITRLCGGQGNAGVTAVWVLNATLAVFALGFVATPDAPSVMFWTATVWALLEALERGGLRWWMLAGLCAGLGVLSKFTNLFLGLGLLLWFLASAEGRGWLRRREPWMAGLAAIAVIAPLLAWNAANDWIGLERQFSRIGNGGEGVLGVPVLLLSSVLLLTPLVAWFALAGARVGFRYRGLLLLTSAPIAVFMLQHALGSSVPGNWLLPLYPVAAVLAAIALERHPWGWTAGTVASGLALGAIVVWAALRPGPPVFPGNTPANQFKGWAEVLPEIERAMAETGAEWVAAERYGLAGQLFVGLGRRVPVHGLDNPKRYVFRGGLPRSLCGTAGLLVTRAGGPDASPAMVVVSGQQRIVDRRSGNAVVDRYRLTPFSAVKASHCPG